MMAESGTSEDVWNLKAILCTTYLVVARLSIGAINQLDGLANVGNLFLELHTYLVNAIYDNDSGSTNEFSLQKH